MRFAVLTLAALAGLCAPAAAQGNGHGNAYGHYKNTVTSATTSPAPASASVVQGTGISGTGVRNFGSWLDDASLLDPGSGFDTGTQHGGQRQHVRHFLTRGAVLSATGRDDIRQPDASTAGGLPRPRPA